MHHLLNPQSDALLRWLDQHGQSAYRADQVRKWLFEQRAGGFDEMTDLPSGLREKLAAEFCIWSSRIVEHRRDDDGTEKLLLQWTDGGRSECVLLRDGRRRTICISTQVGCAMGCVFCASGLEGLDRNLSAGEIVEQMLRLQRLLPQDERLSHIVVMGIGEPLANLDALLPALDVASRRGASRSGAGRRDAGRSDALGIGVRRITISTVGLPAAIRRLAEVGKGYHLAVSLHAANDTLRNQLVPVNPSIGLENILAAADYYFEVSSRRLTFEYVLLAGVNDSDRDARELVALLRGRAALLNVIPYNRVSGLPYRTPSATAVGRFREILEAGSLTVKFRQPKGAKIDAACGQLRRSLSTTADENRSTAV